MEWIVFNARTQQIEERKSLKVRADGVEGAEEVGTLTFQEAVALVSVLIIEFPFFSCMA